MQQPPDRDLDRAVVSRETTVRAANRWRSRTNPARRGRLERPGTMGDRTWGWSRVSPPSRRRRDTPTGDALHAVRAPARRRLRLRHPLHHAARAAPGRRQRSGGHDPAGRRGGGRADQAGDQPLARRDRPRSRRARSRRRPVRGLLPVRVWRLDRDHRDRGRQADRDAQLRRRSRSATSTTSTTCSRRCATSPAPIRSRSSSARTTARAWTRPRSRRPACKPIAPLLAQIAKVKDREVAVGGGRASCTRPGSACCSRSARPRTSGDARQVIAGLDQGGLGLPDRDYYLKDDEPVEGAARPRTRATSPRCSTELGRKPDGREEGGRRRSSRSRPSSRRCSKDKVARRDPKTHVQPDRARGRREGDAERSTGTTFWKTVGLDDAEAVTVGAPEFFDGRRRAARDDQAGGVARVPDVPPRRRRRRRCSRRSSSRPEFEFYAGAHRPAGAWSRAGSAASTRTDARARRAARPGVRARPVRRREQDGRRGAGRRDHRGDGQRTSTRCRGWTRRRRSKAHDEARRRWPTRSATRTSGATYAFKIDPKTWGANALAAQQGRAARGRLAKIGKPVDRGRLVDVRADGQRVLRPVAQRDGVPRGHPAAAVLLGRRARSRSTSARWAWSSATS